MNITFKKTDRDVARAAWAQGDDGAIFLRLVAAKMPANRGWALWQTSSDLQDESVRQVMRGEASLIRQAPTLAAMRAALLG